MPQCEKLKWDAKMEEQEKNMNKINGKLHYAQSLLLRWQAIWGKENMPMEK